MLENDGDRIVHTEYYLTKVEIKYYTGMIGGQNLFDNLVKSDMRIYDNILKITTGQGDDYTIGCLVDYPYFKEHYKLS